MNNFKIEIWNRYQIYILCYHLLFLGFSSSGIIKMPVLLAYLFVVFCVEFRLTSRNVSYFSFFLCLSLISGVFFVFKNFFANSSLLIYQIFFCIIVQIMLEKKIGRNIFLVLLSIFGIYIVYHLLIGTDLDYILYNRSRNMVSSSFFNCGSVIDDRSFRHYIFIIIIIIYFCIST